jgi:hypothetical protein
VILELRRRRQEDLEFEYSLGYTASPFSIKPKQKNSMESHASWKKEKF